MGKSDKTEKTFFLGKIIYHVHISSSDYRYKNKVKNKNYRNCKELKISKKKIFTENEKLKKNEINFF